MTTLTYDALSRLKTKVFNDTPQTPGVTYAYDTYPVGAPCTQGGATAIGKLVQMADGAGVEQHCFDGRGREVSTRRTIDGANYDILKTYDSANRVQDLMYPDGEVVHHAYDTGGGWLNSMCQWNAGACVAGNTYLSAASAKAWMAPESLTLGVGQTTSYSYDYRLRLKTIQTGISAASQNMTLTYDDASNVTCVGDNNDCVSSASGEKVTYTYDALNRLTTGSGYTGGLTASYNYDQIGNLTFKQEGATTLTLPPNPSGLNMPQPHAVQKISLPKSRWFTYDANGNQVGSGNDQYVFDAENRVTAIRGAKPRTPATDGSACMDMDGDGVITILDLSAMAKSFGKARGQAGFDYRADLDWDGYVTILDLAIERQCYLQAASGQNTTYVYDGNGALLKRINRNTSTVPSTSTWTIYVGGIFEKNFSSVTGATGATDYYAAYGRLIAVRQTPATGTMTLSYLLADQLGSTVGAIDSVTGTVTTQKYWPFGDVRSAGALTTDRTFTGQQQEDTGALQDATKAMKLSNYKARFYSAWTGRFLRVDPVVGSAENPQSWNPYTYVRNNPLRLVDPTGMRECATDACDPASSADQGLLPTGGTCDTACGWKLAWASFNPSPEPQVTGFPNFKSCGPSCPGEGGSDAGGADLPLVAGSLSLTVEGTGLCGAVTDGACLVAVAGAFDTYVVIKYHDDLGGLIEKGWSTFWAKAKKVEPHADADGSPHSGFKTDENGRVTGYTEYDANGRPVKRFRGVGGPHAEMLPPLIYEPAQPGGRVVRSRTPTPDELPAGYRR